jgi:hypothetical protein
MVFEWAFNPDLAAAVTLSRSMMKFHRLMYIADAGYNYVVFHFARDRREVPGMVAGLVFGRCWIYIRSLPSAVNRSAGFLRLGSIIELLLLPDNGSTYFRTAVLVWALLVGAWLFAGDPS